VVVGPGPCSLYFGSRSRAECIYKDRMSGWYASEDPPGAGPISELHFAFSRKQSVAGRLQLDVWGTVTANSHAATAIVKLQQSAREDWLRMLALAQQPTEQLDAFSQPRVSVDDAAAALLLQAFTIADLDGSGALSMQELRRALRIVLPTPRTRPLTSWRETLMPTTTGWCHPTSSNRRPGA
jgi:hypothetical protein